MIRFLPILLLVSLVESTMTTNNPEEREYRCGIDAIEDKMHSGHRSFTNMHPDQFWENGQILWSFVSSGDESAKDALYTDPDVGLTNDDFEAIKLAMQQIEEVSCINFTLGQPTKGDPWLFISRDARASDLECQLTNIQNNIIGKDIAGMGDIYSQLRWGGTECFPGAYAWYGSRSPQNFVISQTRLNKDWPGSIGLAVHELLHNLGIGHTQKRQDATKNIKINWDNIQRTMWGQYAPCEVDRDQRCSRYDDYGTEYDCSSIMHYRDYFFAIGNGKTMEPLEHRKHDCDLRTGNSELRPADIEIINQMYKCNGPIVEDNVITSPNYPANYPADQDEQWRLEAEPGSKVSLKFTDFILEENGCAFDWVRVEDGDGTELMAKTCGSNLPGPVVSNSNVMVVKFHTDWSDHFKGFRAEWEKVKSGPVTAGGTIKSPNHPAHYPDYNDTTFHLEVSPGSVIQLTFTEFSVEPISGCIYDYVEILDTDPAPTTKLCGHNLPSPVTSTGNKMTVKFHSDHNVNFPGFSANWKEVSV